jgi:hypothetical protein
MVLYNHHKKDNENNIVIPKPKAEDKVVHCIYKIKPKSEYENIRNIVNGNHQEVIPETNKNVKNKFIIV